MQVPAEAAPRRPRKLVAASFGAALGIVTIAVWWPQIADVGFLGWDAFAALDDARLRTPSDLLRVLTSPFMGRNHPTAVFFRPVTTLTISAGDAVHGLSATGFHATTLALHAVAAAMLGLWLRRLLGSAVPALIGAVLFAVHPAHLETLPYLARRGEVLVALGGFAALLAAERGRYRAAALLCLLAAFSKETGLIFAPLVLLRGVARGVRPVRVGSWLAAAVVVWLFARAEVLGGTGGYRPLTGGATPPEEPPSPWANLLHGLALPPGTVLRAALPWLAAALALSGVALGLLRGRVSGRRTHEAPLVVLLAGAGLFFAAPYVAGIGFFSWYAYVPLAFACGAVALVVHLAVDAWRRGDAAGRVVAGLGLALTAAVGATWIRATAGGSAEGMRVATRAADAYLAGVDAALSMQPRPRTAVVSPAPVLCRSGEREILVLLPYSVVAWSALTHPDVDLVVLAPDAETPRGAPPGRVHLVFAPLVFDADAPPQPVEVVVR